METDARKRYDKFMTSKQEPLRLSLALSEFARTDIPDTWKDAYMVYLRRRIRPGMMSLVRGDDSLTLAALSQVIPLPAEAVEDAITLAAAEHSIAALVWLLRWKQGHGGFPDRDFSL